MILNKNKYLIIFILICCLMLNLAGRTGDPLFIENKGQWPSEVLFLAEFPGYQAWITKKGLVLNFFQIEETNDNIPPGHRIKKNYSIKGDVVYFFNEGVSYNQIRASGKNKVNTICNFFLGNKRINNVRAFREVMVENIYPGIHQRWYIQNEQLRFDFIVLPYADYKQIKLKTDAYSGLMLHHNELLLSLSNRTLKIKDFHVFQNQHEIPFKIKKDEKGNIIFQIEHYDPRQELIIDPVLFSTYLGGSSSDMNPIVRTNSNNEIIIGANTLSNDFPTTPGSYNQILSGSNDIVVSKLDPNGTQLLFSTFIGGSNFDEITDMEIDANGDILICGNTESANFPLTPNCPDPQFSGISEGFLLKLSAGGNTLLSSTFLGGNASDFISAMALDNSNNIYLTGNTESNNFITTSGAFDTSHNGQEDIFVTKIDPSVNTVIFSTFVGSSISEFANDIKLGQNNVIYVCGHTFNTIHNTFPTTANTLTNSSTFYYCDFTGPYSEVSLTRGIIFMLNQNGTQLLKSTACFNSINYKMEFSPSNQKLYMVSRECTPNTMFMRVYRIHNDLSAYDIVYNIDQYNVNNNNITLNDFYSNFDMRYDGMKNHLVVCFTKKFSTTNIVSSYLFGVLRLNADLSFKNYFQVGTDKNQYFSSFTIDNSSGLILAGYTPYNKYICTPNAYDPSHNGNNDLLIVKLDTCSAGHISINYPVNKCIGDPITLCQLNPGVASSHQWLGPNGFSLTGSPCLTLAPAHPSLNGTYSVHFTDPQGCVVSSEYSLYVHNTPGPTAQIQIQPHPVCPNSIFTISALPNPSAYYSWTVNYYSNVNYTTSLQNFTFFSNASSYNIFLSVQNSVGCISNTNTSEYVFHPGINVISTFPEYVLQITNLPSSNLNWIDCSNMQPIPGATLSTYTVTQNGSYAASWAYGTCTGTTACQNVSTIGLDEFLSSSHQWILYPNPSYNGRFFVHAPEDLEVEIMDVSGKILCHHFLIPKGTNDFNLNLPAGIYFIREKKNMLVRKWVVH